MIQKRVEKIIRENKENTRKDAKALFQEFPSSALFPYKFYIKELKLFKSYDQNIVSVRMITYTYTGGAHGGKNYYSWNWSKTKKKFLSLDEAVTPKQFTTLIKTGQTNSF